MIVPDSDDDEYSNPVRAPVGISCAVNAKLKPVVRKSRMALQNDSSSRNPPQTPVKAAARFACISCATRKSACDKKKPSCTKCSQRSFVCTYPLSAPARGAKRTTLPFRKSSDVVKEPIVGQESMFPGLVPTKRSPPGTPRAIGKKSKTIDMDGSFGGEGGEGAWDEFEVEDDGVQDEEMINGRVFDGWSGSRK